ncbi:YesL family protein [Paenibacillus thermoaerophilus]|uniref:YesL family protein n=1 Tax=Paenibacillus thermoaerophilus TaxID=1215385 RepID=A0ABW2V7F4_9BACL|nr:DUF624 domain-containing protein [Paenibacillus thermoaerophilus]
MTVVEMRGMMGGLYRISEWIMRLSVTNVLWILVSLPFFILLLGIFGVGAIQGTEQEQLAAFQGVLFWVSLSMPLFFFPGTSAMFSMTRKWVMGDTDAPLLKTFFRSYKENFKQAVLGGVVFVLLGYVLYADYRFYISQESGWNFLGIVFIVFAVLYAAALFNFFSLLSHLNLTFGQLLKNTFLLTIGAPLNSVALLVTNGFLLYISSKYTFLIPFFLGSLIGLNSFFQFYRLFTRMQDKQEKWKEKEEAKRQEEAAGEEGEDASDRSEDAPNNRENGQVLPSGGESDGNRERRD